MNIIEEVENKWKLFTEASTGKIVFEIFEEADHFAFQRGLRQNKPGYWRERETTIAMQKHMNENKVRNFVVRYGENDYRILAYNGI